MQTQVQQNQKADYQKQIDNLKSQLQAKADLKAAQASLLAKAVNVIAPPVYAAQTAPNDAKMAIYMRESGNNPGSINRSSGACGLGQALPCSKMPCSLSDYACQDTYFTAYMVSRYGTWANAWAFWQQHSWW